MMGFTSFQILLTTEGILRNIFIAADMTDTDKTLLALKEAGPHGVHSFELNHIVGTIRAAARINDLKRKGYNISSVPERLGNAMGVRYILNAAPRKTTQVKPQPHYVFDAVKKVYREVADVFSPPEAVQQTLI